MKRQMKNISKQNFPTLRMRRLRSDASMRKLVIETSLSPHNLIQPMFVIEGKNKTEKIT